MSMLRFSIKQPRPLVALLRRFRRNENGAAAVEFAMVAVPFFAFMFAIIEAAMVFFAGQTLETATQDSARLILTGQAQTGGYSQAAFKQAVCSRIYALFDCNNGIFVDVKSYPSASAINITTPVDACSGLVYDFTYSPGNPGDLVVVRVFYQWPLFVTKFGFNLSDTNSTSCNKKLLAATVAFRNEPY
jgi:Flp pilus assembly protein TadG